MILAPQLAEPLHGERLGRDDQAALDLRGVHQAVEDQAASIVLPEARLRRPAASAPGPRRRALGDVELVREQPDAAAEERAEAAGLARPEQVQDVEPRQEVASVVDLAGASRSVSERSGRRARSSSGTSASLCAARRSVVAGEMDDEDAPLDGGDAAGAEIGVEAVGQVVPDGPGVHGSILPRWPGAQFASASVGGI